MRNNLMALALSLLPLVLMPVPKAAAGEKSAEEDEDSTSFYMLNLDGGTSVTSDMNIRVKIFPHERDYLPHGKDEVMDEFTVHSQKPCTVFNARSDKIQSKEVLQKDQTEIYLNALDLPNPVIIDCPESFTLERYFDENSRELTYSGLLYVHTIKKQDETLLEAVNVLSLRSYLRGVVPSEVYHHWPMEALKSQAVAARTYAVYHILKARRFMPNRFWDVDDTVMYQAYTGTTQHKENTDEAVFATEGQILTYQGNVIQAFYHADSGGATEEASTIWDQPAPFTVARPEASDLEMNKVVWERTISLKDLTDKLKEMGEWTKSKPVARVVVPLVGQTSSGRVKSLALIDQKGSYATITTRIFKKVVGVLPSNLFTVEAAPGGRILIKGLGFGHGVGMSQQGAAALARRKAWSYRQILEYYYVRTALCSIDSTRDGLPDCSKESLKHMRQLAQNRAP